YAGDLRAEMWRRVRARVRCVFRRRTEHLHADDSGQLRWCRIGVSQKAFNWKQRKRASTMSMKERMEGQANTEKSAPSRDEICCARCGFRARFGFVRCPECGAAR